MRPLAVICLASLVALACDPGTTGETYEPVAPPTGDAMAGGDTAAPEPTLCTPADGVTGTAVTGVVYLDLDESNASLIAGGFDEDIDDPVAGATIGLIGAETEWTATTCEGGDWGVGDLSDGVYVVAAEVDEAALCSSRNCTRRFPEAIRSGYVKIVTWGDSVPKVGGDPLYPSRLASLLSPLATVDNQNVAMPGSVSTDWMPGTGYFENNLMPQVPDADVILISVGGNDLMASLSDPMALLADVDAAVEAAMALVVEIVGNVITTVDAIRAVNPDVDVVYSLYPNYGQATIMPWGLAGNFLGPDVLPALFETARSNIPQASNVILADMFASFEGLPLDDYLYDSLHFNDAGHTRYAEVIFEALGGVLVGPSPLEGGRTPLGLEHHVGVLPFAP